MAAGESDYGSPRKPGDRSIVELFVHPGTYHGFDLEVLQFELGVRSKGHWLQYNDAATRHAINRVRSFLGRTLSD